MSDPESLLISFAEAAKLLGISRAHFYVSMRRGDIAVPVVRIGRVARVRREDVEAWAAERGSPKTGAPMLLTSRPKRIGHA